MTAATTAVSLRRDQQQRVRVRAGGDRASRHRVSHPASGALTKHGEPIRLPTRPIHMSTDIPSEHILVAFNNPSAVRVYRVNRDFTPGGVVPLAVEVD